METQWFPMEEGEGGEGGKEGGCNYSSLMSRPITPYCIYETDCPGMGWKLNKKREDVSQINIPHPEHEQSDNQ